MANIKFTSIPPKTLQQSILSTDSSFKLSNILGWDSVALTSADFGTRAFGAFLSADRSTLELFEWDPSTIASTSITILYRGLKFDGTQTTEIPANKRDWSSGSTSVMIGSDIPQLLSLLVDVLSDQTIGGVKIFSSIPQTTGGNATTDNQLVRYAQALALLTGGATVSKIVGEGTAGETIASGQLVYLKASDGRWWLADADTAATVENINLGIAQGAGTAGNAITNGVLTYGLDATQTGLTANSIYYASNTAGGISLSAGTTEVTVGYSLSTTTIFFNPRFNQQITEDQQDALAGSGTPSAGNKFMTQQGLQAGAEVYAASTTGNDTYVVTLSPVPTSLVNGMTIRFKPDTANTGAATLNVNSLGALSIVTGLSTALTTGDILANQVCEVIYNSTGTVWQLVNPASTVLVTTSYSNGVFQQNANSTTTTTIAHGLGRPPKIFRITGLGGQGVESYGSYNGTNNRSTYRWYDTNGGTSGSGTDTTSAIWISYASSSGAGQTLYIKGVVTLDATNATITWTNGGAGNSSLTISYEWEAEG